MKQLTLSSATLPDRVVIITGAANGLGRALAFEFFSRGFHLALIDKDRDGLETLRRAFPGQGQFISIHQADISDEGAVMEARLDILAQHPRIDLLINNAGVSISQGFESIKQADFNWLLGTNFWGTVYCIRRFLPDLRASGQGHIVNIISGFAQMGFPGKTAYAASKGAVTGLSNSLKTELHGSGVGVSLVIPPALNTNIIRAGKHIDEQKRAAEAAFLAKTGMPLAKAAFTIASRVLKGHYRIVIGSRTRLADLAARLFPTMLHRLIGRFKGRVDFV